MSNNGNLDLLEITSEISKFEVIKNNHNFSSILENLTKRIKSKEFRIVVTGEFSTGKSTFINALIGKDILSHATIETTATITYLVNVKATDKRCNTCIINFRDNHSISLNDLSELSKYTTTQSSIHVSNDILNVTIYFHFLDTDKDLIIVDTPGLNGVADNHRELTIEEIQYAHACIYLFHPQGLKSTDVSYIETLIKEQNNFIFILNAIDNFINGDTTEENIQALKQDIIKNIPDISKLETTFCGVSSLYALVGQDTSIEHLYQDDIRTLTPTIRQEIYEKSNFNQLKNILKNLLNSNELNYKKWDSNRYTLLNYLSMVIEETKLQQSLIYDALYLDDLSNDNKNIQEKIAELKDNALHKKNLKTLNDFIVSDYGHSIAILNKDVKTNIDNIYESIVKKIDDIATIEELDKKISDGIFSKYLNDSISELQNKLNENKGSCFELTYKNVLDKIRNFNFDMVTVQNINFAVSNIEKESYKEKNLKKDINILENEKLTLENEIDEFEIDKEINTYKKDEKYNDIKNLEYEIQYNYCRQEEELDSLGSRPDKEIHYRTEVSYIDRSGIFGKIKQAFVGKERIENKIPYDDYTKYNEWVSRKEKIISKYEQINNSLYERIVDLQMEYDSLENEIDKSNSNTLMKKLKLKSINNELINKKEKLELEKQASRKSLLREYKKNLKDSIEDYLINGTSTTNSIISQLYDNIEKDANESKMFTIKEVQKLYNSVIDNRIKNYQKIIDGNSKKLSEKYKDNSKEIISLEKYFNMLK